MIADEWRVFRDICIEPDAPIEQVRVTRLAFYSGAMAMLTALNKGIEDINGDPTEGEIAHVQRIQDEIVAFLQTIAQERP